VTRQLLFLTITTVLLSLMTSCNLTRSNVIGKWKGQFDDTLIINQDNSFVFIKGKFSKANLHDTSQTYLVGQWTLKKKSIYFNFSDTTQNFGGDCKTYQYWLTRGSKKKLTRPMTCKSQSHHFVTITKMN
jgi:hypothetical protein